MKEPKLYDLTQPMYHNCPGWPDTPLMSVSWDYRCIHHGFNAETVSFNTHTGTHIDVPYHFFQDGKKLDDYPVEHYAGPCVIIDLRSAIKPDTAISPQDLAPHMHRVQRGDIVLLFTGQGEKRGFNREYLYDYSYLGGPAAEVLAKAGVKGVGIDALSLGGYGSAEKGRPCHEALLPHDVFIIEELRIPPALADEKRRYFSAFPLPLAGCGGAPARAVVYEW